MRVLFAVFFIISFFHNTHASRFGSLRENAIWGWVKNNPNNRVYSSFVPEDFESAFSPPPAAAVHLLRRNLTDLSDLQGFVPLIVEKLAKNPELRALSFECFLFSNPIALLQQLPLIEAVSFDHQSLDLDEILSLSQLKGLRAFQFRSLALTTGKGDQTQTLNSIKEGFLALKNLYLHEVKGNLLSDHQQVPFLSTFLDIFFHLPQIETVKFIKPGIFKEFFQQAKASKTTFPEKTSPVKKIFLRDVSLNSLESLALPLDSLNILHLFPKLEYFMVQGGSGARLLKWKKGTAPRLVDIQQVFKEPTDKRLEENFLPLYCQLLKNAFEGTALPITYKGFPVSVQAAVTRSQGANVRFLSTQEMLENLPEGVIINVAQFLKEHANGTDWFTRLYELAGYLMVKAPHLLVTSQEIRAQQEKFKVSLLDQPRIDYHACFSFEQLHRRSINVVKAIFQYADHEPLLSDYKNSIDWPSQIGRVVLPSRPSENFRPRAVIDGPESLSVENPLWPYRLRLSDFLERWLPRP